MKVSITNVNIDLGAGRRGTNMGPSAIHVAQLIPKIRDIGHEIADLDRIECLPFEMATPGDPKRRFLPEVADVCRKLADRVEAIATAGAVPISIGGDHSQAIGSIGGLARALRARGEQRLGVLWVDAHGDMNTPDTTPSGNIHGMPMATLLGKGDPQLRAICEGPDHAPALLPQNVVILGARDIDPTEAAVIEELGVRVYTMDELDRRGTSVCVAEAFAQVSAHTAGVHLSFDMDAVDPQFAPGVGTPVLGGLSIRESHQICETVASSGKLLGLEVVECNPALDDRNKTAELAVWLILSSLGKRIL